MKEPELIDFSSMFASLREKMGIKNNSTMKLEINDFSWEDREISADDDKLGVEDSILPILVYDGKRVLLYIKDQAVYNGRFKGQYKFHIAWCKTLAEKKRKGQYNKYVISRRQNNIFSVRIIKNNKPIEIQTELHVCKNCLEALNYNGYKEGNKATKENIYNNFSLKDFFEKNINEFYFHGLPKYNEDDAPLNVYSPDWKERSKILRKLNRYKCDNCKRDFSKNPKRLHVHHRDGNKSNNNPSNLEVLCFDCHKKIHSHLHEFNK